MTAAAVAVLTSTETKSGPIRARIDDEIGALLAALPDPAQLTPALRRDLIARYAAVLEGNFIYWMTGAYLAVRSDAARAKILENLHEEVRDCHPGMLRRFTAAAAALPTDRDIQAIAGRLSHVRLFIGKLAPVPIVITMAFFEGFIQRFMPYLAELAGRQGSSEREYTDVHGICDVGHTEELYRALDAELELTQPLSEAELFEGVGLLRSLITNIVHGGQ